jgi:iduronate 2-sulfatase
MVKGGVPEIICTATHRHIEHEDGSVELYDHTTSDGETNNIAASASALGVELYKQLSDKLKN